MTDFQNKFQNVLFLVTGMTPAIITETVWALACDPELDEDSRWVPDRVEVLSTDHGLNQIRSRLLESNVFETFKKDFPQLANLVFDETCLQSIINENDSETALLDLKTPEDNEFAANQIHKKIRDLTGNENVSLHVSIAGGRKTMGFYAGYALSLHGRAQDSLSHVLVDDKFENIPSFFYPTPYTHYVTDRDGRAWDASKAQVWLAEIPFVRMKDAIHEKHQLKGDFTFGEVVSSIKNSFAPSSLVINLDHNTMTFNGVEISLPPREFAFLHWFADLRKKGLNGVHCPRITNSASSKNVSEEDLKLVREVTEAFAFYYNEQKSNIAGLSVDKTFFNSTLSNLNKTLIKNLGLETATKFQIVNINKKRGNPFFLDLPAEAITIIDTMK